MPENLLRKIKQQNLSNIEKLIEEHIKKTNKDYEDCLSVHEKTPYLPSYNDYPHPPPEPPELIKISFIKNIFGLAKEKKTINQQLIEQYNSKLNDWALRKEQWPLIMKKSDNGNIDAMSIVLGEILPGISWPKETLVNYDFSTDEKILVLDIDLPEVEDMPKIFLTRAARGIKINVKKLSPTQIRRDYAILVHGINFRIIGECFSALQYLDTIILSGYTQRINTATGVSANEYILSVKVTRQQWNKLNLRHVNLISPVDALAQFELVRNMKRNAEMKKIEPISLSQYNHDINHALLTRSQSTTEERYPAILKMPLSKQCSELGIEFEKLNFAYQRKPEVSLLSYYQELGYIGSSLEGIAILTVLKALMLDKLSELNPFKDRLDACQRYLEAQLTILENEIGVIVASIKNVSKQRYLSNFEEIILSPFIMSSHPGLSMQFADAIFNAINTDYFIKLTLKIAEDPYTYRSGWPDLTIVKDQEVRFIEVKTTDKLHKSQLVTISAMRKVLPYQFSVCQLTK
ncbi:VRR-NUC domain-containing protein [Candidatus Berkiella cookevillensis]|uniref:VRR-NUC domain-containing protein n=1 Tax=Candidatus Berkiella cookevillensis TaxID=437022 RepID=A0A0Q9YMK1_9GAMM|nr:VRR-NUC domain-containing protein [Candidatus Berkiella cookevillensis]MCS5709203.1 VRR-NUC domain-containing protein [Candidatus Berkiella cookevillensis]